MEKHVKNNLFSFFLFLIVFIIYTICVTCIDVKTIGPNESKVGFAFINGLFKDLVNVNFPLYNITDWASIVPIVLGMVYGFIGLVQWIKRKSILKVDKNILALGIFYIVVLALYITFEYVVINRRPVLINGYLEASYPSSTTILMLCFIVTSIDQTNKYIKNVLFRKITMGLSITFLLLMVVGRTISGVHWISDIVGSILISTSMIYLYYGLKALFDYKK